MSNTAQFPFGRQYRLVFGTPERRENLYRQGGVVEALTPRGLRRGLSESGIPTSLLATPDVAADTRTIPQDAYETSQIEFEADIVRSNKSNSGSKGERTIFKIKNLNENNRAILEREGTRVLLFAGYGPAGRDQLIYAGDTVEVDSERVDQDWVTTVRCKQSALTFKNTVISLTYIAGASLGDVLADLISRGDGLSIGVDGLGDVGNVTFSRGISLFGKLDRVLDQLCEGFNLTWVDNNGKIIIRPREIVKGTDSYDALFRRRIIVSPRSIKEASNIADNSLKSTNQSNTRAGIRFRLFLSTPIYADNIITLNESLPNGIKAGDYMVTSTKYELESRRGSKWDVVVETEAI